MKSTSIKTMIAKVMTVGLLAGTFVLAVPEKAQAQGFALGVQIGSPRYDYARRDARFEEQRREIARREAFERQRAFERHIAWQRANDRRFHGRDDRFHGGNDFGHR